MGEVFKEGSGLMAATRRVYSGYVCPYGFFAERLLHSSTLFQAGTQRSRMRRVNELSYSPGNPLRTRLLTPFQNLFDLLTGPMQRCRSSRTCWNYPNNKLMQRRPGRSSYF